MLGRLPLEGHETVLDAGCGSGRVTAAAARAAAATAAVVAADAAPSMIEQARERFAGEPRVSVLDPVSLTELELDEPVDAAFSNAVFHWIKDHDALFERLHAALRPGAPLVAQCGGKGNIDSFRRLADEVAAEPPYAEHMASFAGPWNYAAPEETEERLRRAGFEDVRCWLEPWPVSPDGAARVRHDRLPRQPPRRAPRGAAAPVRGGGRPPLGRSAAPRLRAPEHQPRIVPDVFGYSRVCGRETSIDSGSGACSGRSS